MKWRSKRRGSAAIRFGLLVVAAVGGIWVSTARALGETEGSAGGEPPFFAYLRSCDSRPSLIAFNPSRFDPRRPYPINATSKADIRADLAALRAAFDGLVLYQYQPELTPTILSIAQGLGYKAAVIGLWNPKDANEIDGVAKTVSRFYPDLALAVVIGNEGLIENRYSLGDLGQAAERLRALLPAGVAVPLSTSEPIGEYGIMELRAFGDFLAPNVHPAIDQEGSDPATAAAWVRRRARALATVAGKPVLVKETGLPNGGRPAYSPETQRLFWQAYERGGWLDEAGLPAHAWVSFAAAFEAFDLPWKAERSGMPIEGHWGFLNVDREPYPAFDQWRQTLRSASPEGAGSDRGCGGAGAQ